MREGIKKWRPTPQARAGRWMFNSTRYRSIWSMSDSRTWQTTIRLGKIDRHNCQASEVNMLSGTITRPGIEMLTTFGRITDGITKCKKSSRSLRCTSTQKRSRQLRFLRRIVSYCQTWRVKWTMMVIHHRDRKLFKLIKLHKGSRTILINSKPKLSSRKDHFKTGPKWLTLWGSKFQLNQARREGTRSSCLNPAMAIELCLRTCSRKSDYRFNFQRIVKCSIQICHLLLAIPAVLKAKL